MNSPGPAPVTSACGFPVGGKEFYLAWHHRGGLRCPWRASPGPVPHSSPGLRAVPCRAVCTPSRGSWSRTRVSGQPIPRFAEKSKGPSMEDKTGRMGVGESLSPIVSTLHFYSIALCSFGYYWVLLVIAIFGMETGWGKCFTGGEVFYWSLCIGRSFCLRSANSWNWQADPFSVIKL